MPDDAGSPWPRLFLVLGLIILNAVFAASEIAVVSVNDSKVKKRAGEGDRKSKSLLRLIEDPSSFLATIQIGITLVGLLTGAFAAEVFAGRFTDMAVSTGYFAPEFSGAIKTVILIIITLILSYITLIFGELVPKRLAMRSPEKVSYALVGFVSFIARFTVPFVKLLSLSTNGVLRLFGVDPSDNGDVVTEEEIRLMVSEGHEQGSIEDSEMELINKVFAFTNSEVADIMVHRTEIVALPVDAEVSQAAELIFETNHSRYPIYDGSIDNIIGILNLKDFAKEYNDAEKRELIDIKALMRPPYFVPEGQRVTTLFEQMQKNRNHIAIVVDEYGGTAGIATVMDVMESLVGDMDDEYDENETFISMVDQATYVVDGKAEIEDVNEQIGLSLPDDEYETINGFVISQLGRIPGEDEKPEFEYENHLFKIEESDTNRVKTVTIYKLS